MKKVLFILFTLVIAIPSFGFARDIFWVDGILYEILVEGDKTRVGVINSRCTLGDEWQMSLVASLPPWEVKAGKDYSGDVVIPEKITHNGVEYTVTEIGVAAFTQCKDLRSVSMPNTVTKIGAGAFWNCSSLEYVKMSNNVKVLWPQTFAGCNSLRNLDLSCFENIQFFVPESLDYLILPSDGLHYEIYTKENYKCKFVFAGEHSPYPMYVNIEGLPEKCFLYKTIDGKEGFNILFNKFENTVYDPDIMEKASVDISEVSTCAVTVTGNVVTAPETHGVSIYDIAGALVARLDAGKSTSLTSGTYIASGNNQSQKFIVE